jgi:plastocyanin
MKSDGVLSPSVLPGCLLAFAVLIWLIWLAPAVVAQSSWQAALGAESQDQGRQAMAFLPTELWIHTGDSIEWTSQTHEGHTVTFLKQTGTGASAAGTSRPSNAAGCTGGTQGGMNPTTLSGSAFDGSTCVHSGAFANGATYTVTFPNAGNFKFVCLIHRDMTGVVHVLNPAEALPHDQSFYTAEAASEARNLVTGAIQLPGAQGGASTNQVTTDPGKLVAQAGGKGYLAVMRFLPQKIHVHVGDTVEWINASPSEPHTITFVGALPEPPAGALVGVSPDADGARHGTLFSTADQFNSGLIAASLQDQTVQTALGTTRVRVTFQSPGTYDYFCALHDELGMVGEVVVQP